MRIINKEFKAWLEKHNGKIYSRAIKHLNQEEFLVAENSGVVYVEPIASYYRVPNYIIPLLNRFAKENGYYSLYARRG